MHDIDVEIAVEDEMPEAFDRPDGKQLRADVQRALQAAPNFWTIGQVASHVTRQWRAKRKIQAYQAFGEVEGDTTINELLEALHAAVIFMEDDYVKRNRPKPDPSTHMIRIMKPDMCFLRMGDGLRVRWDAATSEHWTDVSAMKRKMAIDMNKIADVTDDTVGREGASLFAEWMRKHPTAPTVNFLREFGEQWRSNGVFVVDDSLWTP